MNIIRSRLLDGVMDLTPATTRATGLGWHHPQLVRRIFKGVVIGSLFLVLGLVTAEVFFHFS